MVPKDHVEMQSGEIKNWGKSQISRLMKWFQKDVPSPAELALYIDKVKNGIIGLPKYNSNRFECRKVLSESYLFPVRASPFGFAVPYHFPV